MPKPNSSYVFIVTHLDKGFPSHAILKTLNNNKKKTQSFCSRLQPSLASNKTHCVNLQGRNCCFNLLPLAVSITLEICFKSVH